MYEHNDQDLTTEIDDVEGHGLKEVAAGLGAAAVVVGGAGSALAMSAHVAPTPSTGNTVASVSQTARGVVDDPVGAVDRTTDWGITTARETRDGAMTTAGTTVRGATDTANSALSTVRSTVDRTTTTAGNAVTGAEATAGSAVDLTKDTARDAVDTAGSTVTGVKGTAQSTVSGAQRTVRSTLDTVRQTVHDLDVHAGVGMDDDGADVSVSAAGHDAGAHVG